MAYIGNSPGVASQRIVTTFTATASQTTFTPTSGYTVGYLDVYHNGVKLINGDDYTASNGSTFVLAAGASAGDVVESVAYLPRGLSDGYTKAEADARYVEVAGDSMTGTLSITKSAATVQTLNRTDSDGTIAEFQKDGTAVGSIGTSSGALQISGGSSSGMQFNSTHYVPMQNGSTVDATIDLGSAARRFKDAYLSGGVYLGGTGAANYLDDYEEGTWTPTSRNAGTTSFTVANYIKIGSQVTLFVDNQDFSDSTANAILSIGGLPFNPIEHGQGSVICSQRDDATTVVPFVNKTSDDVSFYANSNTGSYVQRKHNDFIETNGEIYWTITYKTS
jgi:hypothetical protein